MGEGGGGESIYLQRSFESQRKANECLGFLLLPPKVLVRFGGFGDEGRQTLCLMHGITYQKRIHLLFLLIIFFFSFISAPLTLCKTIRSRGKYLCFMDHVEQLNSLVLVLCLILNLVIIVVFSGLVKQGERIQDIDI